MKRKKPVMALFLHHPECSIQCGSGMYEALSSMFDITFFGTNDINGETFKYVDLIAVPGGIGDSESYHYIFDDNINYLYDALYKGKRYLGICMGAYWAGPNYLNVLDGIDCVQYIKRPRSGVKRSYATTVPVRWYTEEVQMYFYDGCAFLGNEKKFYTVARYKNKDPMAIIQNRYGLIGCHPESMKSWYYNDKMKLNWHEFYHHKLLLDFTRLLMEC